MEEAKEAFLREFGEDYGYPNGPKSVDEIRSSEFKRLEGAVYLDHAGATLYSEAQMEAIVKDLTSNVYGNPHSQNDSSMETSDMIRAAREQVLEFCNASPKDYKCVFTSGATAALKLVGETFPWGRDSCYMYTMENHNSVLGIREYALEKGARAFAIDIETSKQKNDPLGSPEFSVKSLCKEQSRTEFESCDDLVNGNAYNLFAFPSECNFSGKKYHLELVNLVKEDIGKVLEGSTHCQFSKGHWMVLVDAAKCCATQPPDLSKFPVDFVVLSFYKIFGYPTGLGALIVKNEAAKLLKKNYFSGGTVSASIADIDFVKRRDSTEQLLEDGTVPFLSIVTIVHGFRIINSLTTSAISRHTGSLATYVRNTLSDLRHANGVFLCEIYGKGAMKGTSHYLGPIIAFNLRRPDGSWFGYREVEKLASLNGIQLRTGCFCNPGACAKYLGLSHIELISNIEAGHVCWDDHDIINGKPTGAVRVSFGYMSTFEDAEIFLRFTRRSFLLEPSSLGTMNSVILSDNKSGQLTRGPLLKTIWIYPIKSCAGFSVDRWPLSYNGLRYDREWLLKSSSGEVLTQKKVSEMSKVHTFIDLNKQKLLVESSNCLEKLLIPLQPSSSYEVVHEELDLCGERYEVQGYTADINAWFSKAIGRHCSLVRYSSSKYHNCMKKSGKGGRCGDKNSKSSFVNEAQLLLISADSVSDLNERLISVGPERRKNFEKPRYVDAMRFRPNLVVSGAEPYAEDRWRNVKIGKADFTSLGGCNRCQMINLDPFNAQAPRLKEPLATLASYRRMQGKILFGILLGHEVGTTASFDCGEEEYDQETWLEVGQEIHVTSGEV